MIRESAPAHGAGEEFGRLQGVEPGLLPRFFERVTRQTFLDLGLDDGEVARYLIDLLTRFARTDALYRVDLARGRKLETVVDTLLAVEGAWQIGSPDFAPEREQALRQHVGDFSMFMAGVFRDHIERLGVIALYEGEGRRAYRFVAETARTKGQAEAALFHRLAAGFERFTGALTYMRKVYFRDEALPFAVPPDARILRRLTAG